jgi:hypothetical protein
MGKLKTKTKALEPEVDFEAAFHPGQDNDLEKARPPAPRPVDDSPWPLTTALLGPASGLSGPHSHKQVKLNF